MSEISSTSELTTKEVVEQAIQDYHESILPYLNGMVPTIANKFDKANLYSTEEKIVGRWIDGKPLYQKTIIGKTPSSTDDEVIYTGDTNDYIVNIFGFIVNAALNYYDTSNWRTKTSVSRGPGSSLNKIVMGVHGFTNYNYTITIQYTKTTDEAIAIGSDTDYSLEEKIIGTDTDGTPIWQKSFTELSIPLVADAWTDIVNISSLNIDRLKGVKVNSGDKIFFGGANAQITNNNIQIFCMGAGTRTITELTLQYTKTTN